MTRAIYVTLLLVLTPVYGVAAVWRVEKDGSGDFLQIQEAIEAAASGDTVAIGPGLWMKFSVFQASGTFEAIGFVQQEELTLRGAGVDETTLAYAFGPGTTDHPMGIVTSLDSSIRLERMTLSDLRSGVQANGPEVYVEGCRFVRNYMGVDSRSPLGTKVMGSEFQGGDTGIVVFQSLGAKNVEIVDSSFDGCIVGIDLQSDPPGRVENCSFRGTRVGVQVSFGGSASVVGCTFAGTGNVGLVLTQSSSCELRDSVFEASTTGNNLEVATWSSLEGSGNILKGGIPTIEAFSGALISFSGNDIRNSGGTSVSLLGNAPSPPEIDLTNNYWGTTEPAQIAEWIHDANDDPQVTGVVLFEPFAEQSVPTAKSSIGRLKSRY